MPIDEESRKQDETREQGVEFGSLAGDLESVNYPVETSGLLSDYGDRSVNLQDGSETLDEVLGPLDERTFDSPEDVMQTVIGMVGDQAIGRKNYSDRGGEIETDRKDEESI